MKRREQVGPDNSKPSLLSSTVIFLFAFICFFPNPALPIGTSTGLQAGQVLALMSLPVILVLGLPKRQTLALLLLLLPVLLAGFLVVLTGRASSNEVVLKTMVATLLALVVLIPAGKIVNKRYMVPLLASVAWALVLHAVAGFYQAYWFAQDVFPLPGLYQNPSFRSPISQDPETWALYVKRPFGLFPEPSAMAASIGPWLVLIVGLLLYSKLRYEMTRGTKTLLVLAVISGVGLILVSQSGYTVWLLASMLLVGLPALKNNILRLYRPGSSLALVAFVLVGVTIAILAVTYLSPRADVQENSSWSARLASIVWGLTYLGTSPSTLFFGTGPGQSYLMLQAPGLSGSLPPASSGEIAVTAVWSVVVNYVQEAGLLGALVLALILIMVLRVIVRSSARLMGLSCLVALLAGVVFTTSYLPLSPIWLFLGLLLEWDRIFEACLTSKGLGSKPSASSVRSAVKA